MMLAQSRQIRMGVLCLASVLCFPLASCSTTTSLGPPVWMMGGIIADRDSVIDEATYNFPAIRAGKFVYSESSLFAAGFSLDVGQKKLVPSCVGIPDHHALDFDGPWVAYFFLDEVMTEGVVTSSDQDAKKAVAAVIMKAMRIADKSAVVSGLERLDSGPSNWCVAWATSSDGGAALRFLGHACDKQIRITGSYPNLRMSWGDGFDPRSPLLTDYYVDRYWWVGSDTAYQTKFEEPSHVVFECGPARSGPSMSLEYSCKVHRSIPFTKIASQPIYWWQFKMQGEDAWGSKRKWVAVAKRQSLLGYFDQIVDRGTKREDGNISLSPDGSGWVLDHCRVDVTANRIRINQSEQLGWKCIESRRDDILTNGRREIEKFAEAHLASDSRTRFVEQDIEGLMRRGAEELLLSAAVGSSTSSEVLRVPVWELDVSSATLLRRLLAMLYEPKAQRLESLLEARPIKFRCVDAKSMLPLAATVNLAEGKLRKEGVADVLSEGEAQLRSDETKTAWRDAISGLVEREKEEWRAQSYVNDKGQCALLVPAPQSDDELVVRVAGRKAMTTIGWTKAALLPDSMRYLVDDSVDYVLLLGEDGQCVVHRRE